MALFHVSGLTGLHVECRNDSRSQVITVLEVRLDMNGFDTNPASSITPFPPDLIRSLVEYSDSPEY